MINGVMQYINKNNELINVMDNNEKFVCVNLTNRSKEKVRFNGDNYGFDFVDYLIEDIKNFDEFIINDTYLEDILYIVENRIENGYDTRLYNKFYEKIKYYYL